MKYVKFLDFFLIESFLFIDLTERERGVQAINVQ